MFSKKRQNQLRKQRRTFHCENLELRTMMSASPFSPTAAVSVANDATPASAMVDTLAQPNPIGTTGGSNLLTNPPIDLSANALNPNWFTPANINAAYGFDKLGLTGAGQIVAIVEAYDVFDEEAINSNGTYGSYLGSLQDDLDKFSHQFNLNDDIYINSTLGTTVPWAGDAIPAMPPLTKANIGTGSDVWVSEWGREAAMDVEWVHAIAPEAQIDVIEAQSSSPSDLLAAVDVARNAPGVSVVSMSWSFSETASETQDDDTYFTTPTGHSPVTFIAASGDDGGLNNDPNSGARYPASSPYVLAVGATNLALQDGGYGGETAWSDTYQQDGTVQGSGGGISSYERQPTYMYSFMPSIKRTTPDVSFVGDVATPVATYHAEEGGWLFGAGTSFATQAWAGTAALIDQGRAADGEAPLGRLNQDIYSLNANDFHDITSGSNGYATLTGYDMVTGRGTPKANVLVPDLIAIKEPSPPDTEPTSPVGLSADNTGMSNLDANGKYVVAVYNDILERAPDPGGLAYWTNLLDTGTAVSSVAQSIAHSAEYYANFVIKPAFQSLLGRAGGDAEVTYWTQQMQNGLTDQQLQAALVASDEFYSDAGGTDTAWIDAIYTRLLNRTADADGENYWNGQLSAGVSRGDLARAIANSSENDKQLINDDYFHYLGRAADADGSAYWLGQFAAGQTNEDIIAGFTGSSEYYQQHTS
ncbi:MAG TPA: DUF4214 domain-containing protein [Pirellulales bacterium]|nr:DUF4214 domain-containing protein [Pirellulales bacterium]